MADETGGILDSLIHPRMLTAEQIADYLDVGHAGLIYNSPNRFFTPTPTGIPPYGEWLDEARGSGEVVQTSTGEFPAAEPGSERSKATAYLAQNGVDRTILVPMLRGILPAADQGSAVCAAYNSWQADTWLGEEGGVTYLGTIRVNPRDPVAAVKEIERWADDPRMVQIGVPLEAHAPYGQRNYLPIWEAAAARGLPVVVKAEGGVGIDFPATMLGLPRTHIEYSTLHRDRFFPHLASLIAEGVFDHYPEMKVIFADGGFDLLLPSMWRMDMDWPISRREVPWVKMLPSDYLERHVRFVFNRVEGPPDSDPDLVIEWAERTNAASMLIYGSGYPHWFASRPEQVLPALGAAARERILRGNAEELYDARTTAVGG